MASNSTNETRRRYNSIARLFDFFEAPLEKRKFAAWRQMLHREVVGPKVLEAGVGTGKNLPYYHRGLSYTGIDLSPAMLARARERANRGKNPVRLAEMDIQNLALPDNYFDTVFATFVFCSVPDPVAGLKELKRVCKPGGQLLLLEHVRPKGNLQGRIFDLLNPLSVYFLKENINRRTLENLRKAGWSIERITDLSSEVVYFFQARP
ncbi:class I SAM-dependent methyltransferase [Dethiosulfatarculus sandiegensis]|uniref:Methyltransferase type 11 n=1 Tax=Dethiosulfatarculus sandiegensis TaxID=1429043 RepID=A0A0D2GDT1_9BACT|nr:class I SAM-dependent methyltransferase [Dethiosulfatarculus sandiegensis]KIX13117.1 methyltransferase type 11 [Dethiosulfatarculus sandiegensis]